mgnify:CR=1 FL=1
MGLLTSLLTLPLSGPTRGVVWVAGQIKEAAETERNDPAALRAALIALEAALIAGTIDEAAFEAEEALILARLERGNGTSWVD